MKIAFGLGLLWMVGSSAFEMKESYEAKVQSRNAAIEQAINQ